MDNNEHSTNLAEVGTDYISRQAALKVACDTCQFVSCPDDDKCDEYEAMKNLPSAEPKIGRWIEDAETFYKAINECGGEVDENTPYFTDDIACSKCLARFSTIDNETERFDFCPHCGADMRGEQE